MSLRIAFSLIVLSLSCAAQDLPPVFEKWIVDQKSVGNILVSFEQVRSTPTLKEPVKSVGRFWKMQDGRFRWEMGSPATTVMIFDRENVLLKEGQAAWETLKADDSRARTWMKFLSGREMDKESLTKSFTVKATQQETKYATMTLVPKALLVKKHLKQIDMQIEPGGKRMFLLRVIQGDGATLTMTFGVPSAVSGGDGLFLAK